MGWYCGAGVFGLIGCIPLSLSLALPTFFYNNNNLKKAWQLKAPHALESAWRCVLSADLQIEEQFSRIERIKAYLQGSNTEMSAKTPRTTFTRDTTLSTVASEVSLWSNILPTMTMLGHLNSNTIQDQSTARRVNSVKPALKLWYH